MATMDKKNHLTIYITCVINVLFSNDIEAFRKLRDDINDTINTWLRNQENWNRRIKIFVFNMPEVNSKYTGSFRNVDFELHLRRNAPGESYARNVEELTPLVDYLTETIKKTCAETGLNLVYRPSNNKNGMKLKDYVEEVLANDSSPHTSQPQTG